MRNALLALREQAVRVRSGNLEPVRFARSVGLGVLIGFLPIHGLQSVATLALVVVVPVEPLLTWLCTWVGNAATAVPMMWCELQLGTLILYGHARHLKPEQLTDLSVIGAVSLELLLGSLVLATAAGSLAYVAALRWAERRHGGRVSPEAALQPQSGAV